MVRSGVGESSLTYITVFPDYLEFPGMKGFEVGSVEKPPAASSKSVPLGVRRKPGTVPGRDPRIYAVQM